MQKIVALAGILCILFAGFMSADMVSSSISVDGTSWISSALTGDKIYAGLIFTNDRSTINRNVDFRDGIITDTRVKSTGPIGLDEFSSQVQTGKKDGFTCVFGDPVNKSRYDEISTSGLWSYGSYTSARSLNGGLTKAGTQLDGVGMVSLGKISDTPNLTHREREFVAGDMNVSEYVEYGGAGWISQE